MKNFRVINSDNYGSDFPDEVFVSGVPPMDKEQATYLASLLNSFTGEQSPRHYCVVPDTYKLVGGQGEEIIGEDCPEWVDVRLKDLEEDEQNVEGVGSVVTLNGDLLAQALEQHTKKGDAPEARWKTRNAIARRIVACWNHCRGVPTPRLQAHRSTLRDGGVA